MTTTEGIKLDQLDASASVRVAEEILRVYARAMMGPPYDKSIADVQTFAGTFQRHTERPGFRLFVARWDGHIVGYTYGYASTPGGWWRDQVAEALGAELSRRWLTAAFEFAELAVEPAHQGAGLGSALHDALLDGIQAETALLSTLKEDTPGSRLYEKKGWHTLLDEFWFSGTTAPYRVMAIDLHATDGHQSKGFHARRSGNYPS